MVMDVGVSRASTSPRCLAKASFRSFLSPFVLRASNMVARAHNVCRDIRSMYSSLRPLSTVLVAWNKICNFINLLKHNFKIYFMIIVEFKYYYDESNNTGWHSWIEWLLNSQCDAFESWIHVMGMCLGPFARRTSRYVISFYGSPWNQRFTVYSNNPSKVQELKASIKNLISIDMLEQAMQNIKTLNFKKFFK